MNSPVSQWRQDDPRAEAVREKRGRIRFAFLAHRLPTRGPTQEFSRLCRLRRPVAACRCGCLRSAVTRSSSRTGASRTSARHHQHRQDGCLPVTGRRSPSPAFAHPASIAAGSHIRPRRASVPRRPPTSAVPLTAAPPAPCSWRHQPTGNWITTGAKDIREEAAAQRPMPQTHWIPTGAIGGAQRRQRVVFPHARLAYFIRCPGASLRLSRRCLPSFGRWAHCPIDCGRGTRNRDVQASEDPQWTQVDRSPRLEPSSGPGSERLLKLFGMAMIHVKHAPNIRIDRRPRPTRPP